MRIRTLVTTAALAPLFIATSALAQSTGTNQSLGVASTPVSSSVSSGSGVALGTITLTSPGGSFSVGSVPVNLTTSGGGLPASLSNCLIYNSNSASTTTALGSSISPVSGQNSFALSTPLSVNAGSPVTLQIRCDVGSTTPSGSVFQFTGGSNIGASTTGGTLAAEADFVKQIPAGLSNAIVGIITLDATRSNQPVIVKSLPIAVSASNGANLSALTSCSLGTMTGTQLTTGGNAISAITGSNTFTLDTPLTVPAGQGMLLVLRCNVSPTAQTGGMLTVSFSPSAFQATANGLPVMVTQGYLSNGTLGTNSGNITITPVGSSPGTGVGTPSSPGTPNTGAGGNAAANYMILFVSAFIAYFAARRAMRN